VASSLNIPLKNDIIVRKRFTQPQAGLPEEKRISNIKDCFAVTDFHKGLLRRKKLFYLTMSHIHFLRLTKRQNA